MDPINNEISLFTTIEHMCVCVCTPWDIVIEKSSFLSARETGQRNDASERCEGEVPRRQSCFQFHTTKELAGPFSSSSHGALHRDNALAMASQKHSNAPINRSLVRRSLFSKTNLRLAQGTCRLSVTCSALVRLVFVRKLSPCAR